MIQPWMYTAAGVAVSALLVAASYAVGWRATWRSWRKRIADGLAIAAFMFFIAGAFLGFGGRP